MSATTTAKRARESATALPDDSDLTPSELAAKKKTTVPTILAWYRKGIIPATVAEGRVYRFNLAAVNKALEDRARKNGAAGGKDGAH